MAAAPVETRSFAFSIVDDTDLATLRTVAPIYALLAALGMRTTKTVWPLRCEDPSAPFAQSHTLEDRAYAQWIQELQAEGFEIAFHGASGDSNTREKTERGLDRFGSVLGRLPAMHINHHVNRENIYWGAARFDSLTVRAFSRLRSAQRRVVFEGHDPGSPYFWGDLFHEHIRYCRNLTFPRLADVSEVNPTLPYRDPRRPYVPRWFSSCDGGDPVRFVELLSEDNIERLVARGGVCIVYTHFGSGFVEAGEVVPAVEQALRRVASHTRGRFVPASELLDSRCPDGLEAPVLPVKERRRMERTWLRSKLTTGGTS